MVSNFTFLKSIDMAVYNDVIIVEGSAITDRRGFGNKLRQLLEKLAGMKIARHGLNDKMLELAGADSLVLAQKLSMLTYGKTAAGERYTDIFKRLDPTFTPMPDFEVWSRRDHADQDWRFYSGSAQGFERFRFATSFLRQFGNDSSHDQESGQTPIFKITYAHILEALAVLQRYLAEYYGVKNVPPFSEKLIPLRNQYEITDIRIPSDRNRSCCEQEYSALFYAGKNVIQPKYAIIRRYRKTNAHDDGADSVAGEEDFFARSLVAITSVEDQPGLDRVEELVPYSSPDSEFYMLAYVFKQKPLPLNKDTLGRLSLRERLTLCHKLAGIMESYHKQHVFHRMLTYRCVYILPDNAQLVPSIINFSFAKIADQPTVLLRGRDAARADVTLSVQKYLAPEWSCSSGATDWSKADVYSLGMLFFDILAGDICPRVDFKLIPDQRLVALLKQMLSADARLRPDMTKIYNTIGELL